MRYIFCLTLIMVLIYSCEKEESQPTAEEVKNSIANDLKSIIAKENIQALESCCIGCSCNQSFGWGTDYSFPGDNFVRISSRTYNLNKLEYYEIKTVVAGSKSEKRLVLYFP